MLRLGDFWAWRQGGGRATALQRFLRQRKPKGNDERQRRMAQLKLAATGGAAEFSTRERFGWRWLHRKAAAEPPHSKGSMWLRVGCGGGARSFVAALLRMTVAGGSGCCFGGDRAWTLRRLARRFVVAAEAANHKAKTDRAEGGWVRLQSKRDPSSAQKARLAREDNGNRNVKARQGKGKGKGNDNDESNGEWQRRMAQLKLAATDANASWRTMLRLGDFWAWRQGGGRATALQRFLRQRKPKGNDERQRRMAQLKLAATGGAAEFSTRERFGWRWLHRKAAAEPPHSKGSGRRAFRRG